MVQDDEIARFICDQRYSRIPSEFPDEKLYKYYYEAEKIEITLHKGDYLYIPSDWYHFVFSEDTSGKHNVNLAVNFWYSKTRANSENIEPYTGKHDIEINLDEYMNDIVDVTESDCAFFLSNYVHSKRFFNNIDIKTYSSTMSKFLRNRNPYTYIQQNQMRHEVSSPPNDISGNLMLENFWLNFGNVYSQLHCDGYDNILCQVEGSKRVILFNPNQRDKLYLYNNYNQTLIKKISDLAVTNIVDEQYIFFDKDINPGDFVLNYTKRLVDLGYLKGRHIRNGIIQTLNFYSDTTFTNKNKGDFTLFEIQEGSCDIEFTNRKTYKLDEKSIIIFPDEYFYQYRIKLNTPHVSIKYYPLTYYNIHVFNHSFMNVFVKENTSLENMPLVVAEANNKLFGFEIFGNIFKYDMVIDSQSKLWCIFIKKGIVTVNNKVYSEQYKMLVFPIYLTMNFEGEVMCALVQGPPFK